MRSAPRRRLRKLETSPRTLETWLWTGPVGHLLGGAADFVTALARYLRARLLRRCSAQRRPAR